MIQVTIAGVDKTSIIDQQSVSFSQTLSKQPAVVNFTVTSITDRPTVGQTIELQLDSTPFFKGTIVARSQKMVGNKVTQYEYKCLDGFFDIDRILVVDSFSDTTVGEVMQFLVGNYTTGYTLDIPATTPSVKTVRFNYEQPSRCIQKLCDAIGWDWHIDAENTIHVYPPNSIDAPYTLDESSVVDANYIIGSLELDRNIVELKNIVYVRGGEYLAPISEADAVDKYESNGIDNTFPLVYRYNNVQVTRNGVPQNVGIDYINDPALFDCLYNYSEKLVRFPDGTLADGDIIRTFGNAYVPLVVQAEDSDSVTTYGERHGIEINKSINSIEEAESLASAVLDRWREGSKEGSFESYKTGWRVGQNVRIVSTSFGIDETYKINRVSARMHGYQDFRFSIDFIKSGQTTFADLLVSLIGRDRDNITISEDEVLQVLKKLNERIGVTDSIVSITSDSAPYQYSGEGTASEIDFVFENGDDYLFQDSSDLVFVESSGTSGGKYNFATYSSGSM